MVYWFHNHILSPWNRDTIMHALQEIEQLLTTLPRAEEAQVLQWVVRDLGEAFPGIESTPDVCGGGAVYRPHAYSCVGLGPGETLWHQ
jgi:hypothetical protein